MPIWRPTAAFTDSNAGSCWLSTSVLSIQIPSYRLETEWSSLHQWAYKLNWNCQDDHNLLCLYSSHYSISHKEVRLPLHYITNLFFYPLHWKPLAEPVLLTELVMVYVSSLRAQTVICSYYISHCLKIF